MKIKKAEVMGFCMGVQRAVEKAQTIAQEGRGEAVYTYGPLIHNPLVIQRLKNQGVGIINTREPLPPTPGTVIIRAHGVAPAVREELQKKGWQVEDATCPRVLASQQIAAAASQRGEMVIVIGDRFHGEVQAIAGCAQQVAVVQEKEDLKSLLLPPRCSVIAQTTIKEEEYESLVTLLKENFPHVHFEIHRTICPATRKRQEALSALLQECDAVVVIGGRESANTLRLVHTVEAAGKAAFQIESVEELPNGLEAYECVGVSAGASTPQDVINEVVEALQGKIIKSLDTHKK